MNSTQTSSSASSIKGKGDKDDSCPIEKSESNSFKSTLVEYYEKTGHALVIMSGSASSHELVKDQTLINKSGMISGDMSFGFSGGSKVDGKIQKTHMIGSGSGQMILANNSLKVPMKLSLESVGNDNGTDKLDQSASTVEMNVSGVQLSVMTVTNKKNGVEDKQYYLNGQSMTKDQLKDFFGGLEFATK